MEESVNSDFEPINVDSQNSIRKEYQQNNRLVRNILAKDIARKIKSFDHFIYLWGHKHNYYLPPKHFLTWRFVTQVLRGEKKLLKNSDVGKSIDIPKMRGLKVNDLYHSMKMTNGLHHFFPDMGPTDTIPRTYFFDVGLLGISYSNANSFSRTL